MGTRAVEVLREGDAGYEQLGRSFVHRGAPALIVRCRSAGDVAEALRMAREQGLEVSVRSGGHSGAGLSTNVGGLVIDLSPLDRVEVLDRDAGLVRLGPGAHWSDVAATLAAAGLAFSSGDTTSVGVGGLLLGGGIGWLVRLHGLAVDNLVAAEVVTGAGEVVRASADEHADLFWALRGGGGVGGVVTAFEVRARPLSTVRFGTLLFPAEEAAQVLRRWRDAQRAAPETVTTTLGLPPTFGGPAAPVLVTVCDAGDDPAALEPFRALGTLIGDDVATMPYAQVLEDPGELPPGWQPVVRNRLVPEAADAFLDAIAGGRDGLATMYVQLRGLGGAMGRVAPEATAFAHRDAEVMVLTALLGSPVDQAAVAEAFEAFWDALRPHTNGAYGNFLSRLDDDGVAAGFPPATRARLAQVAATYDPADLLRRVSSRVQAGG